MRLIVKPATLTMSKMRLRQLSSFRLLHYYDSLTYSLIYHVYISKIYTYSCLSKANRSCIHQIVGEKILLEQNDEIVTLESVLFSNTIVIALQRRACGRSYRFVFIDPVILPPSSLITKLYRYPRGTDSRVKKKEERNVHSSYLISRFTTD